MFYPPIFSIVKIQGQVTNFQIRIGALEYALIESSSESYFPIVLHLVASVVQYNHSLRLVGKFLIIHRHPWNNTEYEYCRHEVFWFRSVATRFSK